MRSLVLPPFLLGIAMLAACQKQELPPDEPVAVSVMEAHKQAGMRELTATGEIAARTQSELSFRLRGRLSERLVDVGSHVVKGQLIARVDPGELHEAVTSAEAGVVAAESHLRQTALTLNRQTKLFAQGNTPRRVHDQAETAFRLAQSSLEGAQTTLETSQEQLAQTELRASADGMITVVSVEVGEVVQPAQSAFVLAEDEGRDAVFNVSERSLLGFGLSEGTVVQVRLLAPPSLLTEGKVREIGPTVDPMTGTVRIRIGLENASPFMTLGAPVVARASIPVPGQIVVPWQALTADQDRQGLWIVDRGTKKVSLRPVSVARYLNDSIVLSSGVNEGETVVVKGAQLLHPNQLVAWGQQQ